MAEQMQHTPGPWRVVEKGRGWRESWREIWAGNLAVVRADGYYSSKYDDYEYGVAISEPNARRIVACVNACEGIPTEALEDGVVREAVEAFARHICGSCGVAFGDDPLPIPGHGTCQRCVEARTALAKLRGDTDA